jgi:hypothetical protein
MSIVQDAILEKKNYIYNKIKKKITVAMYLESPIAELLNFSAPIRECRLRRNDEERAPNPFALSQVREEGNRLDSLAQAHLIYWSD